ncbi:chorismate synthase [Allofournierella massiliensis]|uniref:chorismate synthase n=1 Tax=Allofournierella massiliensis TaxID=1650663 RepID=UPI0035627D02
MKNTYGSAIALTIFGESHGAAIGAVLDGLAAGIPADEEFIAAQMEKRRAKKGGLSTSRVEADKVRFLSGVYNGRTTGTAITMVIENTNTRSGDYAKTLGLCRPGHADYTAHVKYGGFEDFRGGGHFSGRITAALCAAGALCQSILLTKGIRVATHAARIAGVEDEAFALEEEKLNAQLAALDACTGLPVLSEAAGEAMQQAIRAAASEGDSVGGVLETAVTGLPAGAGEPFFDSVESQLAHLLFSIPAVKGVEFGAGFAMAGLRGSVANDPMTIKDGRVVTTTNNNGGVNGGITNGMPLVVRTAVKPTPSIYKPQQTVDMGSMQPVELQIQGRHDPCIAHRAAIVQTAAVAFGLVDLLTQRWGPLWQAEEEAPWNTD